MNATELLRALSRFATLLIERTDPENTGDVLLLGDSGLSIDDLVRAVNEHAEAVNAAIDDPWTDDAHLTAAELVEDLREQVDELACDCEPCAESAESARRRTVGGVVCSVPGRPMPTDQ